MTHPTAVILAWNEGVRRARADYATRTRQHRHCWACWAVYRWATERVGRLA